MKQSILTPEQLMQPRFKVIADYPGAKERGDSVGDIRVCPDYDNEFTKRYWCSYYREYPHLFRELSWWEERKPEEMPAYVKIIKTKPSYGLKEGAIRQVTQWEKGKVREWVCDLFPIYASIEDLEPATEAEYLNYINQK